MIIILYGPRQVSYAKGRLKKEKLPINTRKRLSKLLRKDGLASILNKIQRDLLSVKDDYGEVMLYAEDNMIQLSFECRNSIIPSQDLVRSIERRLYDNGIGVSTANISIHIPVNIGKVRNDEKFTVPWDISSYTCKIWYNFVKCLS